MTKTDAKTFLAWLKRGTSEWRKGKKQVHPTVAEVEAWRNVMDAKQAAGDHRSVREFAEDFLSGKQGELM